MRGFLAFGLVAAAASGAVLVWAAARRPAGSAAPPAPARRYPRYGWVALAALAVLEGLLALRTPWVTTFFPALIWTAFIPAVDAGIYRHRGDSPLHHPGPFGALWLLSVPIWLIFEAYNLRLQNWRYVGVPSQGWLFLLGGAWAFATILPGLFLVAELLLAAGLDRTVCSTWDPRPGVRRWAMVAGAVLVMAPVVLPTAIGRYLFGAVWVGFVPLLEPVSDRLRLPSVLGDLGRGRPGRLYALLASGGLCGFLWEFWNYWAVARWEYIFPLGQSLKVFAMPLPGFLGFPPFALECFALSGLVSWLLLPAGLRPDWPAMAPADEATALSAVSAGQLARR
ncbi:MAG: hypothetical protein ACRD2E_11760 [Terriglobales bacterium]